MDVLALHEPSIEDATNPEVIETLANIRKKGQARAISIAGSVDAILAGRHASTIFEGAQFPNSPFSRNIDEIRKSDAAARFFFVTHSVFDPEVSKRLAQSLNMKSDRPRIERSPAQLLIDYALAKNPAGTVVLSMYSGQHIIENCMRASQEVDSSALLLVDDLISSSDSTQNSLPD